MKEYTYVNDIGRMKKIIIGEEPNENGKYNFTLWDLRTGEFCGQGKKTKEEMINFLKHYKTQASFDV